MPTYNRSKFLAIIAWAIILFVIIADQALKVWIKTNFYLNEDLEITSWFHLHFVQNNGMAFGLDFLNKHILTFLRLGLFGFLIWYIRQLCRRAWVPVGYIVSIALIAAGAFGNIIDCVCYGEIFTNPYPPMTAELVPWAKDTEAYSRALWSTCYISAHIIHVAAMGAICRWIYFHIFRPCIQYRRCCHKYRHDSNSRFLLQLVGALARR